MEQEEEEEWAKGRGRKAREGRTGNTLTFALRT